MIYRFFELHMILLILCFDFHIFWGSVSVHLPGQVDPHWSFRWRLPGPMGRPSPGRRERRAAGAAGAGRGAGGGSGEGL